MANMGSRTASDNATSPVPPETLGNKERRLASFRFTVSLSQGLQACVYLLNYGLITRRVRWWVTYCELLREDYRRWMVLGGGSRCGTTVGVAGL